MKKQTSRMALLALMTGLILSVFTGCDLKDLLELSSDKEITSFMFISPPAAGVINESAKTIAVSVPAGTVVTALAPTITVSAGASVSPASGVVNNFTNPAQYTVTAADGSSAVYTVIVTATGGNPTDPTDPGQPSGTPQELSGYISASRTLPDLGFAIDYIVPNWVTVNNNAILTVEPGVCIAFQSTSGTFSVSSGATLKMLGTAAKPIQLRGAGATSGTEKGSWNYLDIGTNSDNILQYVEFINGGKDTGYGVVRLGSSGKLSMSNCKISGSLGMGLSTASGANLAVFANNIIENCNEEPVHLGHISQAGAFDETSTLTNNGDLYVSISAGTLQDANLTIKPTTVPYYFTSWITVKKILTVNAGVTFYMHTNASIDASDIGCLKFNGTAALPIKFLGYINSTEKGSWRYIEVNTTNDNVFEHVEMVNGGNDTGYGVVRISSSGKLSMTDCKISGSKGYGLSTASGAVISAFTGNVIEKCNIAPVHLGHISQAGVFDMSSDLTGNGDGEVTDYIEISYGTLQNANLTINPTTVPYYFTSWIGIQKKLTVNAGVTFYMHTNAYIETSSMGQMVVTGTAASPVKFTRLPGMGYYWKHISLNDENGSSFTHCIFEYGGKTGEYGMIQLGNNKNLTLNDVTVKDAQTYGVYMNSNSSVTHSNVTFSNCGSGNVRLPNGQPSTTLP